MKTKTVFELADQQTGIISSFKDDKISGKLLAMGIIPHSPITMIRKSPFRQSCYIKSGQTAIALRKEEAQQIIIKTEES